MNPGLSLSTVSVMMLGSIEYIDTWVAPFVARHGVAPLVAADVGNTTAAGAAAAAVGNGSLQGTAISFLMLACFILLMPILLMNLLVSGVGRGGVGGAGSDRAC